MLCCRFSTLQTTLRSEAFAERFGPPEVLLVRELSNAAVASDAHPVTANGPVPAVAHHNGGFSPAPPVPRALLRGVQAQALPPLPRHPLAVLAAATARRAPLVCPNDL